MSVESAASASSTASSSTTGTKSKNDMIASNFQAFLTLLTTQLKNQNPLDPLDTNQFTQQLVQFASVEQQLKSNDTLSALLTATQSTNLSNATSFVGKTVTADGSTAPLKNGSAKWNVNLPSDASKVTLTVTDDKDNVVWTETTSMAAGDNAYTWNGKTSTGAPSAEGNYKLTVNAVDGSGAAVAAATTYKGVVDGVSVDKGVITLKIGDKSVSLDKILSVVR